MALQHRETDFLHHEVAREAVCGLYYDRAGTVRSDPRQQGGEARARLNRISAAHSSIVEPIHNRDTSDQPTTWIASINSTGLGHHDWDLAAALHHQLAVAHNVFLSQSAW
jgi:hypothetical protein